MYEKIISDIECNLDNNDAKSYLINQFCNYYNHEDASIILKKIISLSKDYLKNNEKKLLNDILDDKSPAFKVLDKANQHMINEDIDRALNVIEKYVENTPLVFKSNDKYGYYHFENPLDELLFNKYENIDNQNISFIPNNHPIFDLYYLYAYLLIEKNNLEKAIEIIDICLSFNPISSPLYLELSEIYKKQKDYDQYFNQLNLALKYAYNPLDLARAYRNIGYYYVENNNLELATALYIHSLKYELSDIAYSEIEYINSKGFNNEISPDEAENILKDNNIQLNVNPFIIESLNALCKTFEKEQLTKQAIYFYQMLYELTLNEDLLDKIYSLQG